MRSQESVGMKVGDHIAIARHNRLWPQEFDRVRDELLGACGARIVSVNHVGSTSVAGLDAKPIIDVLVGVPHLEQSLSLVRVLEALGFEYRSEDTLPDRHYFPRTTAGLRRHHLSLAEPDSWHYRATLAFRDALRRDVELAARYAALKRRLALEVEADRLAYVNGKSDFVLNVLRAEGLEPSGGYPTQFGVRADSVKELEKRM